MLVDKVLECDVKRRSAETEKQALSQERNSSSKLIGQMMKEGRREEAEELKKRMSEVGDRIKELDAVASAEIQDSIFETFAGKTKMIVTHDLSLLTKADQVVVLDGGKLVGCGIYHQLKETCPQLQQLLDANISGEERAV